MPRNRNLGRASAARRFAPTRFSVRDYPFISMHQIIVKNNENIGSALKAMRLTPPKWRVLAILQERDGIHIGDLSRETAIERSLLSRILSSLERDGLVRKVPSPKDRRYTAIYLKARGHKTFRKILPAARRQIEQAIAGVSKPSMLALTRILRQISQNLTSTARGSARRAKT